VGEGAESFLGLDSWGVSTSGWGSGLVGLECANAQNTCSYCELLGGIRRRIPGGVVRKLGVITPLRGCRKLPERGELRRKIIKAINIKQLVFYLAV